MCQPHWDELKSAIKKRGLFDFVAPSGEEAMKNVMGELAGERKTRKNFDPLMAANLALTSNAMQAGGIYLLCQKEDGSHYCPVCEANAHGHPGWIELAANDVAKVMAELPAE